MAKYMIGVTEAGDASVNLQWEKTLEKVDGAILVTKNVSKDFRAAVMRSPNKRSEEHTSELQSQR